MWKRRKLLFCFVCTLLGVLLLLAYLLSTTSTRNEPKYNGIPLQKWVTKLQPFGASGPVLTVETSTVGGAGGPSHLVNVQLGNTLGQPTPANEAIRHLGTNSLPWLVEWISYEPPAWLLATKKFLQKHMAANKARPLCKLLDPRSQRAQGALRAFAQLGPTAFPAIPALNGIAANTNAPVAAASAKVALTSIALATVINHDPKLYPTILPILTNSQVMPPPVIQAVLDDIAATPAKPTITLRHSPAAPPWQDTKDSTSNAPPLISNP